MKNQTYCLRRVRTLRPFAQPSPMMSTGKGDFFSEARRNELALGGGSIGTARFSCSTEVGIF